MDLLRIILCVICPPVAVFMRVGLSAHFVLSLLLTFAGYVPGLVHGIWVLVHYERLERARSW